MMSEDRFKVVVADLHKRIFNLEQSVRELNSKVMDYEI